MRLRASLFAGVILCTAVASVRAQIRVHPTGVNVNAQGATTVFLTFGGLAGYQAVEAFWCGELVPADPDIGLRCDPATIFGRLPIRYDLSGTSGVDGLTDIMTIPPSVARRAYQAAEDGAESAFYYVRRFRSTAAQPDQYVAVTCRLTGGGARTPLSLTDVRLAFVPEVPILQIAQNEQMPSIEAMISYTGTGRLVGRWEIVQPGEPLPTPQDLLTEATLPQEERGTQQRYTQLERFNVFLPPTGRIVLPGPDPSRLPTTTDGVHYILLRIEVSQDKEGDSDLGAAGAGSGVVASGAVAGFPIPVLRYVVGSGLALDAELPTGRGTLQLLMPLPGDSIIVGATAPVFTWQSLVHASLYRIELETSDGEPLLTALVQGPVSAYRAPPWLGERAAGRPVRWRVMAIDAAGRELAGSDWRDLATR